MANDRSRPVPEPGPAAAAMQSLAGNAAKSWALSGASAVAVGFARFDYALILPAMKTDLGLTYAQAGWLNTVNGLGYLLGALLAIFGVGWLGNRRLFAGGTVLATLALLANGLTHDFALLTLCRFLAGLGGAGAFICGGVLAGTLGGRAIGIFFGGAGLGVVAGGVVLPWLFHAFGPAAWPQAWLLTGAVCALLSVAAIRGMSGIAEPSSGRLDVGGSWRGCGAAYMAYFVFGLGYIAYMTFMIAWVRQHTGTPDGLTALVSAMWVVLGLGTLLAPVLWRGALARCRNGRVMSAALMVVVLGAVLPLVFGGVAGIMLSAVLVGFSVLIVPSSITHFVKANLPKASWGSAMAIATSLFAIGQVIGPVACGWLSDHYGSLSVGLAGSAVALLAGAVLAARQKALDTAR